MNIVVLCKQVPDTKSKIKLLEDGLGYETKDLKWVLDPYDEYAVEEALKIKEAGNAQKVIALSAGPSRSADALLNALAMGADEAILLEDDVFCDADSFVVAKALSVALGDVEFGMVLCGKQAVDGDMGAVPQMLAELLGIAQVTAVSKVELDGDSVTATREIEGGAKQLVQGTMPILLSVTKGINEPRYAGLPGIMKAKRKPMTKKSAADVGYVASDAKTAVVGWSLPAPRAQGKIFAGNSDDLAQRVTDVVRLLRDEAKVI